MPRTAGSIDETETPGGAAVARYVAEFRRFDLSDQRLDQIVAELSAPRPLSARDVAAIGKAVLGKSPKNRQAGIEALASWARNQLRIRREAEALGRAIERKMR